METVKCLTPDELQSRLEDLKITLLTLPRYLPVANEFYNFGGYTPEPESVQDYGEEGALNRDLENTFCPNPSPNQGRSRRKNSQLRSLLLPKSL